MNESKLIALQKMSAIPVIAKNSMNKERVIFSIFCSGTNAARTPIWSSHIRVNGLKKAIRVGNGRRRIPDAKTTFIVNERIATKAVNIKIRRLKSIEFLENLKITDTEMMRNT